MFTDLERFIYLISSWGLEYGHEEHRWELNRELNKHVKLPGTTITIREGDPKVDGYCNFHAVFKFDEQGAFARLGLWE